MSTRHLWSNAARLVVVVASLVPLVGCGSEMLRTGRAPVYMVINNITTEAGGGGGASGSLLSDVQPVFNDIASVSIGVEAKNPTVETTGLNAVTLTRYRVVYRRTDGRNTPGVDVPYGFDGGLGLTIPAGGTGTANFDVVRHQAKLEPPLKNLTGLGGQIFISTIAEITFYGHDQNGNEVAVTGRVDIQFADFADE